MSLSLPEVVAVDNELDGGQDGAGRRQSSRDGGPFVRMPISRNKLVDAEGSWT